MASGRPDYTQVSLIRGNCSGVGLVTVAVDSSGNIIGILQGEYAGSLKTLAVDGQGRMLAVLTDPEDVFGNPHYMGAAELAARLGSPARFNRQGQVVFADPGGVNTWPWSGAYDSNSGFEIVGGAEGFALPTFLCYRQYAGAGESAKTEKRLPRLSSGKIGGEMLFAFEDYDQTFDVYVGEYDQTNLKLGGIRFDVKNGKLKYLNSSNAWAELSDLPFTVDGNYPHNIKLVLDPEAAKYSRVIIDDTVTDLSSLSMYSSADTHGPAIFFRFTTTADAGSDADTFMSNIVITCNEV